jgi:hypothetical protein
MKMTPEEKKAWVETASNERLLEQLRFTVLAMRSDVVSIAVEANQDYALIEVEILRRMKK